MLVVWRLHLFKLLVGLLQETLVLGKLLSLGVDSVPLLLSGIATLSDMSLDEVIGLGDMGINQCLVVNVDTWGSEERNKDNRQQCRGREPGTKSPDGVKDTNELWSS